MLVGQVKYNELFLRLSNSNFVAKEIKYLGICRVNCQNETGRTDMTMKKNWEKKLKETLQNRTTYIKRNPL